MPSDDDKPRIVKLSEVTTQRAAVLYARVSTEDQAEKYSLPSQFREMRALAEKSGYKILTELVDDGYTGGDMERPALAKTRELVRNGNAQAVIVYDPDRLSRKLAHTLILDEEFDKHGARLEFVTTPNTDTIEGKLLLSVKGVIAEYEKEKIRERTIRGRREKARQGFAAGGKRPYGYRLVGQKYSPDPDEAHVVENIFRWAAEEGLSIRGITARLNATGAKPHSAATWAKSSVQRILSNDLYIGKAYYNRRERVAGTDGDITRHQKKTRHVWKPKTEWISVPIPPIVDAETFAAVQRKLTENIERKSGRPSIHSYLLRGLLKCGVCGRRYAGNPTHGELYYRCSGKDCLSKMRCPSRDVSVPKLDGFVWRTIARLLSDPDLLEKQLAECVKGDRDLDSELKLVDRQIADIRAKEGRLLEALLDDVPLPGIKAKAKELADRRLVLEHSRGRLLDAMAANRNRGQIRAKVLEYCRILSGSINDLDFHSRQQLLNALVDEVIIIGSEVTIKGILPIRENCPQSASVVGSFQHIPQGIPFNISHTFPPPPRSPVSVAVGLR